ncbi:unnamed protein product [Amoebophrya sp. A25]|nr:unnamed protein product [Amoebophrya sp. A25]|eukprot:GSA25T00000162001.1
MLPSVGGGKPPPPESSQSSGGAKTSGVGNNIKATSATTSKLGDLPGFSTTSTAGRKASSTTHLPAVSASSTGNGAIKSSSSATKVVASSGGDDFTSVVPREEKQVPVSPTQKPNSGSSPRQRNRKGSTKCQLEIKELGGVSTAATLSLSPGPTGAAGPGTTTDGEKNTVAKLGSGEQGQMKNPPNLELEEKAEARSSSGEKPIPTLLQTQNDAKSLAGAEDIDMVGLKSSCREEDKNVKAKYEDDPAVTTSRDDKSQNLYRNDLQAQAADGPGGASFTDILSGNMEVGSLLQSTNDNNESKAHDRTSVDSNKVKDGKITSPTTPSSAMNKRVKLADDEKEDENAPIEVPFHREVTPVANAVSSSSRSGTSSALLNSLQCVSGDDMDGMGGSSRSIIRPGSPSEDDSSSVPATTSISFCGVVQSSSHGGQSSYLSQHRKSAAAGSPTGILTSNKLPSASVSPPSRVSKVQLSPTPSMIPATRHSMSAAYQTDHSGSIKFAGGGRKSVREAKRKTISGASSDVKDMLSAPTKKHKQSVVVQLDHAVQLVDLEEKDIQMCDLVRDQERRTQLLAVCPGLKQTLEHVEQGLEHTIESAVRVAELRPQLINWLVHMINRVAGNEVTQPGRFLSHNHGGRNSTVSDLASDYSDSVPSELDLFEDRERMSRVEKMLPSVRSVHEELRRKSSTRRETATKLVEFHVLLRTWVGDMLERLVQERENLAAT